MHMPPNGAKHRLETALRISRFSQAVMQVLVLDHRFRCLGTYFGKITIDKTANFTAHKNWHHICVSVKVHERRDVTMIVIKWLFDVSILLLLTLKEQMSNMQISNMQLVRTLRRQFILMGAAVHVLSGYINAGLRTLIIIRKKIAPSRATTSEFTIW